MGRFQFDSERHRVALLIDAEVERARAAEKDGGWITYLIRDPRYRDQKGNPGRPIYVGQSKEFGTRVRTRFDRCEKSATRKDSIEKRMADLLRQGIVATYDVLDRQPTRLASLVSETNWARECITRGYDIANQLAEQRVALPAIRRSEIPHSWIWKFTLSEALEDDVSLVLGCRHCGIALKVSPAHLGRVDVPPTELSQIKANPFWKVEPCTACNVAGHRYLRLEVGGGL